MEIYNQEEHRACYCHNDSEPIVEVKKLENGEIGELTLITNEIVLIVEGSIKVSLRDNPNGEFHKGQFIFFPAGDKLSYKTAEGSVLIVFRLHENIDLCYSYGLERLYDKINKNIAEKPETLIPLTINSRLKYFANGLMDACDDGVKCRVYYKAKITELFILLRTYYTSEQLCLFFFPILNPACAFSGYVRMHWLEYGNVSKLAKAMNMTLQQFNKKFNGVFGQTPYKWMQQEKARLIYSEICQSDKPLKEIAWDYNFSAYTHFSRFCKEAFGINPGEIRK